MTYTYQHYPLALYLRGAFMAVANKAEEDAMRAEGWSDWHADQAAMRGEVPPPRAFVAELALVESAFADLPAVIPVPAAPGLKVDGSEHFGADAPFTASVGVHSVIDQAAIAEARKKRKYTRKAK